MIFVLHSKREYGTIQQMDYGQFKVRVQAVEFFEEFRSCSPGTGRGTKTAFFTVRKSVFDSNKGREAIT